MDDQDLIFKLRSIGVRVEGKDALVDTDVLKAVLEGKRVATPREVIVRDEEGGGAAASRAGAGRRPVPPRRPRTRIQRPDRVPTLPPQRPPRKKDEAQPTPEEIAKKELEAEEAVAVAAAAREAAAPGVEEAEDKAAKKAKAKPGKHAEEEEEEDLRAYRGKVTEEELEAGVVGPQEEEAVGSKKKTRAQRRKESSGEEPAARTEGTVTIVEGMTVREFADKLGIMAKDLIKKLFERGMMANINHVLEPELAEELALELGYEAKIVSFEEEIQIEQGQAQTGAKTEGKTPRAPVVTIMGHVDHGKTTLLDAFRESRLVDSEHGGITQHIAAYQVERNGKRIVFLDTPGHEAFTQLRARGAAATDLVILVVAADDGVMPQTVEAIDHARAAGVPILVALNKIDKANANPDRVKTDLSERGLMPEDWGGDTVTVPISALQKQGIDELLEMVLLTAELQELRASPELPGQGVIIEARKEVGRGIIATVLLQDGTTEIGDTFVAGATHGRVRSMTNDRGERLQTAGPATPMELTGFQEVPAAGDLFQVVQDEAKARGIADFRQQEQRRRELAPAQGKMSLEQLFDSIQEGEVKELPVVLKADVQGSVEVLRETLAKLSTDEVKVRVIHGSVGAITTNDVLLASASEAIVIGFNVRPERNAADLAEKEGVDIRLHTIIYELTDELKKAMVGLLEPTYEEAITGRAEVRELFKIPRIGTVAGSHVTEGVVPRNASARVLRDNVVVHDGKIGSLRRFKDDVSEVRAGFDCGISLERFQDVKPGDVIEAYVQEEVAPTL
jgi:translation initiation factor IF-2